jgi:hypothetical protein
VKNSGEHPESARMGLTWFGYWGCKREGRRFVGQYVMTQNDVMRARPAPAMTAAAHAAALGSLIP